MDKKELLRLIDAHNFQELKHDSDVNIEKIEALIKRYPYFQTARLLYTKELQSTNKEQFAEELSKTALLCADRKRLFYLIQPEDYIEFLRLPDEEPIDHDRTDEILDSYFKTFGENIDKEARKGSEKGSGKDSTNRSNNTSEDSELNYAITDYLSYIESLGEGNEGNETTQTNHQPFEHQDIIDAFIEKKESDSASNIQLKNEKYNQSADLENNDKSIDSDDDSEFLTETLAKIYIKQKKYDKALTIIKRLSLNFPKKSAYFADQIRFLEYLIINDKQNK